MDGFNNSVARRFIVVMLLLFAGGACFAGIEDGPRHTGQPEWMTPAFVDLESDLEQARANGKSGVMVLFTTQGCTYCAEFINRSLGDPILQRRVRDNFVSIGLEIFDDAEMVDQHGDELPIKKFAEREQAGMAPTLLFYGPDNDLIFRAIGYQSPQRFAAILDYLIGGSHRDLTFRDYLAQVDSIDMDMAAYPALQPDPMFIQPPYALARKPVAADRPMLVLFEQAGCTACKRFHHDVLALDEIRDLLVNFDVVRLDVADARTPVLAPDGSRTTPADWYAAEGFSRLPAMLYLDEAGDVVFRNDAVTERQRMSNMTGLVLEKKYADGWTYQRYARNKAIERNRLRQQAN
jgi:thioredoxin-related protein